MNIMSLDLAFGCMCYYAPVILKPCGAITIPVDRAGFIIEA